MLKDELAELAVQLLQDRGFAATRIEEGETPTPDILATDPEGHAYVIEIKGRTVPWAEFAEPVSSRVGIGVGVRTDSTGPSSALSRVMRKAAEQLSSARRDEEDLRLIWFFVHPTDRGYHYVRIRHTVYGIKVVLASQEGRRASRQGIYVAPAEFVRWRDALDGVLLGHFEALLLNDLSPRYDLLKGSHLATLCGDGVVDPRVLAEAGTCYYLPPDGSSPTPENVIPRLEQIYRINDVSLESLHRFSAGSVGPEALQEPGSS